MAKRAWIAVGLTICLSPDASGLSASPFQFIARWGGITKDIAYAVVPGNPDGLFVVGSAFSHDFPVSAGRRIPEQRFCAFVTSLNHVSGALRYSTVLCSRGMTFGRAAALSPKDQLWVAGSVDGMGLPVTASAFQRHYGGSRSASGSGDGFVARWSSSGEAGSYASYLGGSGDEIVNSVLAARAGGAWFAGHTTSPNFPPAPGAKPLQLKGKGDGFLVHIAHDGRLQSSVLIGGTGVDDIQALADYDPGRLLVAGSTTSSTLAGDTSARQDFDGFILLWNIRSASIEWERRIGARGDDRIKSVVLMPNGDVVGVGDTDSSCSPAPRGRDAWVVVLSPKGALKHQYCFGGEDLDELQAATRAGSALWVTGRTRSTRLTRVWTGAVKLARGYDRAFVAQFDPSTGSLTSARILTPHVGRGHGLAAGSNGILYAVGETTDAGRRFFVPPGSQLVPTSGAFSTGSARGTTDPYVVAFQSTAQP